MKMRVSRVGVLLATNLVLTVTTAAVVGPSSRKLADSFGLVDWAARAPFYLLPLYLTPLILWVRPVAAAGAFMGFILALPLALWAKAAACPVSVQLAYLVSGLLQGALLGAVERFLSARQP
jgi:ABC-type phosphate/phosphonate transport system permease subunit